MKVNEWLNRKDGIPITATSDWSLEQAADALLRDDGARDLFVTDSDRRLIGHLSLRRVAQLLLAEHLPIQSRRQLMERVAGGPLRELMDPHVVTATPDEDLDDVLHRIIEQGLEELPVVDAERHLLGVINLSAVLRVLRASEGTLFG